MDTILAPQPVGLNRFLRYIRSWPVGLLLYEKAEQGTLTPFRKRGNEQLLEKEKGHIMETQVEADDLERENQETLKEQGSATETRPCAWFACKRWRGIVNQLYAGNSLSAGKKTPVSF